ncbi:Uncharacterized protein BN1089_A1_01515 [Aneurinibacillus migulanus]|nr:Uncharacterized protein BN1089_A1_01515 [Aneurinibacillus migulanus]
MATTPVFAAEQESNPIQQEEGMAEQEEYSPVKKLTVDEIMAQKGMKSALESFYNKFPRTKAYKIMGSKVPTSRNGEELNEITLFLESDKKEESFYLYFDIEKERITAYIQTVNNISESELPGKVQASLDKVYSLSPETKNLKLYSSFMSFPTIEGEEQLKTYMLSFNESGKREEGKTTDKEFDITFDETGKVLYFTFNRLPLVNLQGNTKEEKAQDLLKRLYEEEANEYKIKKVNEISKDDLSDNSTNNDFSGSIVFMPLSSEKEPIVIYFNSKDELTMSQENTRDFLEDAGLL